MKKLDWKRIGLTAFVNFIASVIGVLVGSAVFGSWNYAPAIGSGIFIAFTFSEYFTRRSFYYHNGEEEK